ncbi:MAG TPA: NAD(P)H-dependent oxidoreductase [Burkholderiales bacterium]|nr:NAD(P)H-dependent oxidoreductase [Burkholderiales bacterium]
MDNDEANGAIAREQLLKVLSFRHACKLFDAARSVAREDIDFILQAGRLSPSSLGLEHWRFIVVQDPALKLALQAACQDQAQLGSASAIIVVLALKADLDPDSEYVATVFHGLAPTGAAFRSLLAFYRRYLKGVDRVWWSVAQCHIAAANMMTAAAAIGIDSCPIGGFDPQRVRRALGIDDAKFEVALLLPIGYRAEPQPPLRRLPLSDLVKYR